MRFAAIFAVALLPLVAGAQSLGSLGGIGSSFSVSVSPQYPAPFGTANVLIVSDSLDLARATLSVLVDGKETYSGAVRTFSVPLKAAGAVTKAQVTITVDGVPYRQTLSITPQDVVLIAEPISSVPPLYLGKALIPLEGRVRIVAVASLRGPDGKAANPASYAYTWTVDGVRPGSASGLGKSAIVVDSPYQYRSREVSVVVTSADGSLSGGSSLTLSAEEPFVRMYENDPLLGILYDRAVSGSYAIADAESTLYAAPFALSTALGAPVVEWFLNGSPAQTGNSITLRPTGSGRGSASLSVTASSGTFADAVASVSLLFGETSSNFFGL